MPCIAPVQIRLKNDESWLITDNESNIENILVIKSWTNCKHSRRLTNSNARAKFARWRSLRSFSLIFGLFPWNFEIDSFRFHLCHYFCRWISFYNFGLLVLCAVGRETPLCVWMHNVVCVVFRALECSECLWLWRSLPSGLVCAARVLSIYQNASVFVSLRQLLGTLFFPGLDVAFSASRCGVFLVSVCTLQCIITAKVNRVIADNHVGRKLQRRMWG